MTEPLLHVSPSALYEVGARLDRSTVIVLSGADRAVGVGGLPGSMTQQAAEDLAATWTDHLRGRADEVLRYSDLAAAQASSLPAADSDVGQMFRGGGGR